MAMRQRHDELPFLAARTTRRGLSTYASLGVETYLFTFCPPGPEDLLKETSHRLLGMASGLNVASQDLALSMSASLCLAGGAVTAELDRDDRGRPHDSQTAEGLPNLSREDTRECESMTR